MAGLPALPHTYVAANPIPTPNPNANPNPTPTTPSPATRRTLAQRAHRRPHKTHRPGPRRPPSGLLYFGFPVATLAELPLNATTLALHITAARASGSTANALALLRYAAGCALPRSHQVTATVPWGARNRTIVLPGSMALAPAWAESPLNTTHQRYVTACLAARTNLLSKKVPISLRIPSYYPADGPEEVTGYPVLEGAFWGNMFDRQAPSVHACTGPDPDTPRLSSRFCAHGRPVPAGGRLHGGGASTGGAGTTAAPLPYTTVMQYCGDIQPVGPCTEACKGLSSNGYQECKGQKEVMTVYLSKVDPASVGGQ